ncbi:M3 family metallopeptidase [uncultured Muribaculum sp.]|uniref:M3 family metallopeptidase n=6 Tax=uncultured Muribaculum sp. TaxID=1918613 RepID=UPI0025AF378B|nr:M3 family metallopeptidase [uncultured Muribaculum sp.]
MKKELLVTTAIALSISMSAATNTTSQMNTSSQNPFLKPYVTNYGIPPFEDIKAEHYLPALEAGIAQQNKAVASIIANKQKPTFENTILALDHSGETLEKVCYVFMALDESNSTPEHTAVGEKFYPLLTAHNDEVAMNPGLFKRIKTLYDNRNEAGYTKAQMLAVEKAYKSMVRSGALLNQKDQAELKAINSKLSDLYQRFNKNLLAATNEYKLIVDNENRLGGLPANVVASAKEKAKENGMPDKWIFTLHAPSRLPLLQFANDRQLRHDMYTAYTTLASSGKYNNYPIIAEIIKIRARKAAILGYPHYAAYMTEKVMAKNVKNAEDLLMQIWKPAIAKVAEEVAEMQSLSNKDGNSFKIEPWDYYYYAEKVRKAKYDLDEDEVSQYFPLENVRKGIFEMANRLYGITFVEIPDAPKYDPEVTVYDVLDSEGKHVAVFMTDYFTRPSKRQGAWMSEFKGSYIDDKGIAHRPIIYNVCNFSHPTADAPALLSIDNVATMFHEFGHGLHGMLSRAKYKSQAGTNTDRDFVELPSQIHEHWAMEPELLKSFARHYKTGETIPDDLIAKLQAASTHNQGFTTTELAGAALLDLKWGQLTNTDSIDVESFEREVASQLNMPAEVQYRYRSPYFKHVFGSDEYSCGYYTYLWAEVLDTDGFELFKEKGIFDPETARSFRENVLEMGGSEDPMELFIKFRGRKPTPDALLRNRGLIESKELNVNTPEHK